MAGPAMAVVCALALALATIPAATAQGGWTVGRATFYDDNTEGACRYGRNIPTMYAAWPDGQRGAPACGQCYEVVCVNRDFTDGYGKSLSRSSACYDDFESVIVKIVDSCPCVHENYYSNQRWCCNDAPHIDLARAAFKRIARESIGVVGAKWRRVDCPGTTTTTRASATASGSTTKATASSATTKVAAPPPPETVSASSASSSSSSRSSAADDGEDEGSSSSSRRSSGVWGWWSRLFG